MKLWFFLKRKLEFGSHFFERTSSHKYGTSKKIWGAHQQNIGTQLTFAFVLESG